MTHDEDHDALAAEYVLGTLDPDERAQVETLIGVEPEFAAVVRRWERRLNELHLMVGEVEPSPQIWQEIKARIAPPTEDVIVPQAVMPEAAGSRPAPTPVVAPTRAGDAPSAGEPGADTAVSVGEWVSAGDGISAGDAVSLSDAASPGDAISPGDAVSPSNAVSPGDNVIDLRRRFRQWRGGAIAAGALAASLALFAVALEVVPDHLPQALRPRVHPAGVPAPGARFVAVLQRDAATPAFLLTVDVAQRSLTVRRVAAEQEPGKSYELWLVSDQFPQPRSLGVVGTEEFTTANTLAPYDANTISDATFAVSLEPEGGSPSGLPTGPVLWMGKLLEAMPET